MYVGFLFTIGIIDRFSLVCMYSLVHSVLFEGHKNSFGNSHTSSKIHGKSCIIALSLLAALVFLLVVGLVPGEFKFILSKHYGHPSLIVGD